MSILQYYSNGVLSLSGEGAALLSFLPASMQDGTNNRNIAEILGVEFERLVEAYSDVQLQFAVSTATWGLSYWEEMLALPIQTDVTADSLALRRTLVQTALLRDSFTSEEYFQSGIGLLAGVPAVDVIITGKNRETDPYSWRVEVPIDYYEPAPGSPPVLANAGAGNVPAGTYTYKVSFEFVTGETLPSAESSAIVLAGGSIVTVSSIPISSSGAIARKIYRKIAADSVWTLVGSLANNTDTIFTDNSATTGADAVAIASAKSEKALRIDAFVAGTKPAHINVEVGSVGFRADDGAADVDPL